jgi:hypothetical protein
MCVEVICLISKIEPLSQPSEAGKGNRAKVSRFLNNIRRTSSKTSCQPGKRFFICLKR